MVPIDSSHKFKVMVNSLHRRSTMLTILDGSATRDCAHLTRRNFLRAGALGLGGLTLAGLIKERAEASAVKLPAYVRDRSVILLFLSGGPSQFETFDPKLEAPSAIRTATGVVRTKLPGVIFGDTFPGLASRADKLTVVRSFATGFGDHPAAARFLQFETVTQSGLGSLAARLRGELHPATSVPTNVQLLDYSSDSQISYYRGIMQRGGAPGELGPQYAPFDPSAEGDLRANMSLNVPVSRFDDRRELLKSLDRMHRGMDASGRITGADRFEQQAVEVLFSSATRAALDLSREDTRLVEAYDTSEFSIAKYPSPTRKEHPSPLGRQLLMARRLCEAGCGFVTVGNASWDMHGGMKEQAILPGMHAMGGALDKAVSAFIDDVESRGLQDKILLVIAGEMGRTPKINEQGGRDHWGKLSPLVLYGGGLTGGRIVGASTRQGEEPAHEPLGLTNLYATVMHRLFDLGQLRLADGIPAQILRQVEAARPIPQTA